MLMAHPELFVTRAPPAEGRAAQLDVLGFLDSLAEENSTAERCYRSHSRSSVLQGLPFGGVPTVLAINVVLWMVRTHPHKSITLLNAERYMSMLVRSFESCISFKNAALPHFKII